VQLVGNGVDFTAFRRALESMPAREADGGVCIGYLGAIAPWFDFDLVAAAARERPQWRFALIGPVLSGAEGEAARLSSLPNVELRPGVSHDEVPAVLRGFSVGMIPFRCTTLTAGVNPNKLYEYLAAALPTVATPFSPEVDAHGRVVALSRDAAAFVRSCEAFLSARSDPSAQAELERRALEIARAHDWDRIAETFWSLVCGC
jgi:glycosyltransferase involved in cell wall biosynthesis